MPPFTFPPFGLHAEHARRINTRGDKTASSESMLWTLLMHNSFRQTPSRQNAPLKGSYRLLLSQQSLSLSSLLGLMLSTLHLPPVIALLVLCLRPLRCRQILTVKPLKGRGAAACIVVSDPEAGRCTMLSLLDKQCVGTTVGSS